MIKIKLSLLWMLLIASLCTASTPNSFIAFIPGIAGPGYIAITPNNNYAYVTDQGSNSVIVIDVNPSSLTFNTVIPAPDLTGVFNNPNNLAATPNSKLVYVADSGSNSVLIIDSNPKSPTFNTLIDAPGLVGTFNAPIGVVIPINGLYAYVINSGSNSVNVIDINPQSPTYNTILTTPALDGVLDNPFAIAITPNGKYAYITNINNQSVTVIDTDPSSATFNTALSTPGLDNVTAQPLGIAITANGMYGYVTDNSGSNDVVVIDTNPASPTFNTVINATNLLGAFNAPNGVATTTVGNYAYVSNFLGASGSVSSVSVIDTNSASPSFNSVLSTPALVLGGTTRFISIAAAPNARYIYAVDAFNNTVDVIFTGIVGAPLNVSGCTIANVFLTQVDYVNRLAWTAPIAGNPPVGYKIYRDAGLTQFITFIPAIGPLQYDDHNRQPNNKDTYYIVSIDDAGTVSAPAIITVTQMCR